MSCPRRVLEEEEEEEEVEEKERSWESFLPMASLRVLLVEGDDSTRHIIAALLRKCNYKGYVAKAKYRTEHMMNTTIWARRPFVAAVADGSKAWETLKENPQRIDLVLAEVEAASVSGLDLLTMISDHEICKNIPVIMMSSHDSISMVYKFMLKGAADFLVKPIRRNELQNLWQHVWRRHPFTDIHGGKSSHQDENLAKRKQVDMSKKEENLIGYAPSTKKHKGCSDKASQAESSCTRSEMEAESTYRQNRKEHKQSVFKDSISQNVKGHIQLNGASLVHEHQAESNNTHNATMLSSEVKSVNVKCVSSERSCALIVTTNEDPKPTESVDNNDIGSYQDTRKKEAIDLIGTMENQLNNGYAISNKHISCSSSSLPLLELSLRRYQDNSDCNAVNNSGSSAFLQYNGRAAVLTRLTPLTFRADGEECFGTFARFVPDQGSGSSSTASGQYDADVRIPAQNGKAIKSSPRRFVPQPVPVRPMNFDGSSSGYGELVRMVCQQPSVSPSCSNIPSILQQAINKSSSKPERSQMQETNVEMIGEQVHVSSIGDSGSSSVCNGTQDRLNHNNMTNYCNTSTVVENGVKMVAGIYQLSQREAALNKFRMKRKGRCFEKKVRYQSRKNLAEQRPRVKGQFVRHVQPDPALTKV